MRTFLAIELPDDVRTYLAGVRDRLRALTSRASFTSDQNLHITIKFLGEVDQRKLEELIESMSRIRASGPIELAAQRIECFPERGPVRIVAANFGGNLKQISALHSAVEQRCAHLGFARETRRYIPHVTLARARPTLPPTVREQLDATGALLLTAPTMLVSDLALLESHLRPTGSEYRLVRRFSFLADR